MHQAMSEKGLHEVHILVVNWLFGSDGEPLNLKALEHLWFVTLRS